MEKHLKNFSAEERTVIEGSSSFMEFAAGQTVLKEGQQVEYIYLIESGHLEVIKITERPHRIGLLGPGQILGDISFVDQGLCPADVRALEPTRVKAYRIADINQFHEKLLGTLAFPLANKLRNFLTITAHALDRQAQTVRNLRRSSLALLNTTIVLGIYIWLLHLAITVEKVLPSTAPITFGLLIIFFGMLTILIVRGNFHHQDLGLTLTDWRASVRDSLKWTAVFMAILVLFKYILISTIPRFSYEPLFNPFDALRDNKNLLFLIFMGFLYCIVAVIQEILTRGFVQNTVSEYFKESALLKLFQSSFLVSESAENIKISNKAKWQGIIFANVLFSAMHLHVSYTLAALVFIPGLFWGWLYSRHKTLIGVCLSHIIIGIWVGYILGFTFFFH